jgi:hypothetical protein
MKYQPVRSLVPGGVETHGDQRVTYGVELSLTRFDTPDYRLKTRVATKGIERGLDPQPIGLDVPGRSFLKPTQSILGIA